MRKPLLTSLALLIAISCASSSHSTDRPHPAATQVVPEEVTSAARYLATLRASIRGRETEPAEKVFSNIQVLQTTMPGITAERLLRVMEIAYSRSLGVDCTHCHTPGRWDDDGLEPKQITRSMSVMTTRINRELLASIDLLAARKPAVNCTTCHRGQTRPALTLER